MAASFSLSIDLQRGGFLATRQANLDTALVAKYSSSRISLRSPLHTPAIFESMTKRMRMVKASGEGAVENESTLAENSIDIQFLAPEEGSDSQSVSVKSGEKVLRKLMLESKLPLYDFYGTIMNCGGGGTCGTCLVEIVEGNKLLSPQTSAEDKYLKNKPKNWRLACQTILGDGSNSGQIVVQRLPQKKK